MSNSTKSVLDIVNEFSASLSTSGTKDLLYYWLEEQYRFLRELDWVWNWTDTNFLTLATSIEPVDAGDRVWNWTEGSDSLAVTIGGVASPLQLSTSMTGRKVKLDDEWYRVKDYGIATGNTVVLDRPIAGSGEDIACEDIIFVRDEYAIKATRLRLVRLAGEKIPTIHSYLLTHRFLSVGQLEQETGEPVAYEARDDQRLARPAYEPLCTPVAGAGDPADYIYFFTRYCPESNLESAPGPATTYSTTTGNCLVNVVYNNINVANVIEGASYHLRLYRSEANPGRARPPMFLVDERVGSFVFGGFEDNPSTGVRGLPRYHDGSQCVLRLAPPPDDTRRTLRIEHVNNWHGRPHDEDMLDMGREDSVQELLRIFLLGVVNLQRNDPAQMQQASKVFRAQMNYLLQQSRSSAHTDAGPGTYIDIRPGGMKGSFSREDIMTGDWVDRLLGEDM